MDPISANSNSTVSQPTAAPRPRSEEARPEETVPTVSQASRSGDTVSVSANPVQELQLQRTQVVEELGRSQQVQAQQQTTARDVDGSSQANQNVLTFPARSEEDVSPPATPDQADQLAQDIRQQFQQNPTDSLQSQARSAERQTTLTLFQ